MIWRPSATTRCLTLMMGVALAGSSYVVLAGAQQAPRATNAPSQARLFTEAQATAGKAVYERACARCHGATLADGTAPRLVGPAFQASLSDPRVTLDDLFFIIRTTMPPRASGTLSPQDHAAVFAYVLKTNGYQSGSSLLSATAIELRLQHLQVSVAPAAPVRTPPPAFISGAPGAAPATSGPSQALLNAAARSTEWLFHTHEDRKSTRLNSSHIQKSRMPSSA